MIINFFKKEFGERGMWWLFALIFVGLIYRLGAVWYALPYANVFGDELPHTLAAFSLLEQKTIIASFSFYYLPPLMAYILAPIFALIGAIGVLFGVFQNIAEFKGFVILNREYFLSVSRIVSALFGTATIPFFFLLTKKLTNTPIAWIAIIIFTFDFWNIHESQIGHIWSPIIFFIITSLYFSYLAYEDGHVKKYHVLATLFSGFGYGMGQVPAILFLWYVLAHIMSHTRNNKNFIVGSAIFIILVIAFSVLNTGTFINHFSSSMQSIASFFGHRFESLPYASKIARFSYTENWRVIGWSFFNNNPLIALFGLLGFLIFLHKECFARYHQKADGFWCTYRVAIIVGFPVFYLVLFSSIFYSFTYRYILPASVFFIICTAYFIWFLSNHVGRYKNIIKGLFIVLTLGYSLFLDTVYFRLLQKPYTEEVALEWVYKNIPAGSKIITDTYLTPNKDSIEFLKKNNGWIDAKKNYLAGLNKNYPEPSYFVVESNLLDVAALSKKEREADYLYIHYYHAEHLKEKKLELFPNRVLVAKFYPKEKVEDLPNMFNLEARMPLLKLFWPLSTLGPYVEIYKIK